MQCAATAGAKRTDRHYCAWFVGRRLLCVCFAFALFCFADRTHTSRQAPSAERHGVPPRRIPTQCHQPVLVAPPRRALPVASAFVVLLAVRRHTAARAGLRSCCSCWCGDYLQVSIMFGSCAIEACEAAKRRQLAGEGAAIALATAGCRLSHPPSPVGRWRN